MNALTLAQNDTHFPVDGRELHAALKIGTPYRKWFPRMAEYGFVENQDFCTSNKNVRRADGALMPNPQTNHSLSIDMAKHICMIQRTQVGMRVRQQLIEIENSWNTPERLMARALKVADETIARIQTAVVNLRVVNSELAVQNQLMAPKAEYFDELVSRGVNINLRTTAKELGVREQVFVQFLLDHKYLYRDKKGKLTPYAQHSNDLFVTKECYNEKTEWSGTQTLVPPKARETFCLLLTGLRAR